MCFCVGLRQCILSFPSCSVRSQAPLPGQEINFLFLLQVCHNAKQRFPHQARQVGGMGSEPSKQPFKMPDTTKHWYGQRPLQTEDHSCSAISLLKSSFGLCIGMDAGCGQNLPFCETFLLTWYHKIITNIRLVFTFDLFSHLTDKSPPLSNADLSSSGRSQRPLV